MVKKKTKNKITLSSLLKGKFLVDEDAPQNWKFLFFIFFLGFLMVLSSHSLNNKVSEITKLKEQTDELKTQYAHTHSKLMKLRMESELAEKTRNDSLKSLEKNPSKIVVKRYDN
ncbi:MAG: S-adenosyl-methyltransferase [Flavobacteriales bacterium]|nr:S-adenosyl-methyltransferase [Flavobacteriales bacterium]